MEATTTSVTTSVEELTRMLLQRKNIQHRFKWTIGLDNAKMLLKAAYIAEVKARYMTFADDDRTNRMIDTTAEILTKDNPKLGIMFSGTCGNGKTTMLNAIRLATGQLRDWHKFPELEAEKFDISIQIVDARDMADAASNNETFAKFKAKDILALEDLGKESAETMSYGNVLNPTMELIEARYAKQKYTLITTNLTPKQIRDKYGARIADRFNEMLDVVVFEDGSYRKHKNQ